LSQQVCAHPESHLEKATHFTNPPELHQATMTKKKGACVEIGWQRNQTHQIAVQPQKRGAKNYFTGSRLALLEHYTNEYIMLHGKSRRPFWHDLFSEWWGKYPWHLPDDKEPPANKTKMEELAYVGEDEKAKVKVEARLRTVSSLAENFCQLRND
jgi:hypothetical protein